MIREQEIDLIDQRTIIEKLLSEYYTHFRNHHGLLKIRPYTSHFRGKN